MKPRIGRLLSSVVVMFLLAGSLVAGDIPCEQQKAIQADAAADGIRSWDLAYRFYRQFLSCDDASIAEGVSDKIAKLLTDKWDSFGDFIKLASKDKGFEKFVLRHVDETIDWSHDAPKIHDNARAHCPKGSARLCRILVVRTTPEGK
jgi:hypothetical protein